jgi:hypothetical protein
MALALVGSWMLAVVVRPLDARKAAVIVAVTIGVAVASSAAVEIAGRFRRRVPPRPQ